MKKVEKIINLFERLSLADLDRVKLMNRIDSKFCLDKAILPAILNDIAGEYFVLEINDETILQYNTTYFDTVDDKMYLSHQNGKRNRYKIRTRKYVITDDNFLEIKFKTNKGRTKKERINRCSGSVTLGNEEKEFLALGTPYSVDELEPKLYNVFNRITLVNRIFSERVTIDLVPLFENKYRNIQLNKLVIIEIKQDKYGKASPIVDVLKKYKIKNDGFSKYCIGRALLEDDIKKNSFKPKLLKISNEFM